jgi:hypothetical protein
MNHHGYVGFGKGAPLEQKNLSSSVSNFLGWSSHDGSGYSEVIDQSSEGHSGSCRHCSNHVVTTGVSDPRESVVFRTEHHVQRPASHASGKSRRQPTDAGLDVETGIGQKFS